MKGKSNRHSGFTLIELLVVIAIIAVLAAILFPVFVNARQRGIQTICLSNLKELGLALRQYCDENNGRMPSCGTYMNPNGSSEHDWCGGQLVGGVGKQVYPETGSLFPYVKTRRLYLCPSDRNVVAKHAANMKDYALSYSMNWFLHHFRLDAAESRAKVLMLIHEGRDTINDGLFLWNQNTNDDMPDKVHWDGTTALYVDLHAKWVPYSGLVRARASGEWRCFRNQGNPPNNLR